MSIDSTLATIKKGHNTPTDWHKPDLSFHNALDAAMGWMPRSPKMLVFVCPQRSKQTCGVTTLTHHYNHGHFIVVMLTALAGVLLESAFQETKSDKQALKSHGP